MKIAQLTSDLVWLVDKTITLPDGTTQSVLAPQLYVRPQPGDLDGSGSLLSGAVVKLRLTGDAVNSGSVAGRQLLSLDAANLNNLGGRITGNDVALTAAQDLHNTGGRIDAVNSLVATAGRDLTLGTVTTAQQDNIVWDARNHLNQGSTADIGTRLQTQGDIRLTAGNDLTARAAQIRSATGAIQASAANNLTLSTGQASQNWSEARHNTQRGLLSSKTSTRLDSQNDTVAVGTTFAGNSVSLTAGNDLAIQGSSVSAQTGLAVLAGGDIRLSAAQNSHDENHFSATRKSGLTASGYTQRSSVATDTQQQTTHTGSRLTSEQGNLTLAANLNANADVNKGLILIEGSRLNAERGSLDLAAKHLLVTTSADQSSHERTLQQSKSTWAFNTGLPTGKQQGVDAANQQSTLNASRLDGATGVNLTAPGVIDLTAAQLKSAQGDLHIQGGTVSIQSGINQTRADYTETFKKTGVNLGDLTGLFTPGEGIGFKSTLTKEAAHTSLAKTTLDARNIAIQSSAGDLTLAAVDASADSISLDAAHDLKLASLTTTDYLSTDLKKKDLAWQSVKGNGSIDHTPRYTQLNTAQLNLSAGNRITADLSVKASAAILAREPGMDWLKQLQADPTLTNKIDWNKIEQAHQSWHYKQQGLTPAAAAVVAIVVAYFTVGAGSGIVGGVTGTAVTTTSSAAIVTASAIMQAGVTTLASKAAVSLINNGGRLDETLKELGSQDNLKQLATSLVTAGVLSSLGNAITVDGKALNSINASNSFAANVGKNLINGLTRATVTSAITGTDLETSIRTEVIASVLNAASAQGANWIGDQAQNGALNEFGHAFAHAVAGCVAGAAGASAPGSGISGGSGCGAGALGAAVGELSAGFYNAGREQAGLPPKTDTVQFASMISGIAAAVAGQDAQGVAIAAGTGANAAQNNWLNHADAEQLKRLKQKQQDGQCGPTCEKSIAGLEILDKLNNRLLLNACVNGTAAECQAQIERDPAALQYGTQHIGVILGGRILSRAPDNADKALASLSQALAKTQIKPLVDAQGVITGWAVDLGGADPDTLRYWAGAGVYVGAGIILPTNAIELVPGLGRGLKVVTRGSERVVVEEASGKVLGKIGDASKVAPGGGLAAHEYAGGHLIDRHVGLAESDLATRLASDPKIQVASTFTDRATAKAAVSTVLDSNTVAIQNFLSGSATKPLVLNGSLPNPVGISLSRGATNSVPVSSVTVVLLRDASMPTGYRILTGYPKP